MSLDARIALRRGGFRLQVSLRVDRGEVVALLGPNGAGKSTVLRALAGLERLERGWVVLDDEPLDDVAAGVRVRPERRPVGVVFQDLLLFPHLSLVENVAFGLRCRGASHGSARAHAESWLDQMGLADMSGRRPRSLSGGQAQRVALARALAPRPRLLLLDEPLSALDARTRLTVRSDLSRHLDRFDGCAVVVTHDPVDAMVLGERLVVLEGGRVAQEGPPAEVARHPRTQYVARLVGVNLYRGQGRGAHVELDDGGTFHVVDAPVGEVFVAFSPRSVAVHSVRPRGSPRNVWPAHVAGMERLADLVRVELTGRPPVLADVTPAAVAELDLRPGAPVWVAVKASEMDVYPA